MECFLIGPVGQVRKFLRIMEPAGDATTNYTGSWQTVADKGLCTFLVIAEQRNSNELSESTSSKSSAWTDD